MNTNDAKQMMISTYLCMCLSILPARLLSDWLCLVHVNVCVCAYVYVVYVSMTVCLNAWLHWNYFKTSASSTHVLQELVLLSWSASQLFISSWAHAQHGNMLICPVYFESGLERKSKLFLVTTSRQRYRYVALRPRLRYRLKRNLEDLYILLYIV